MSLKIDDTKENRELFKHLISDFEKYKANCAELFVVPNQEDIIYLGGLQYHHSEFFPYEDHIRFDKEYGYDGMYITNGHLKEC